MINYELAEKAIESVIALVTKRRFNAYAGVENALPFN